MKNSIYQSDHSSLENLVDIRGVSVDKSLPKDQRIAKFDRPGAREFIDQVRKGIL